MPQHRFASIHVVGTNGKSSVTRMIAALLEAHGVGRRRLPLAAHRALVRAGADPRRGDRAAARSPPRSSAPREAAETVNRSLEEGEAVTQFEVATAAAFVALAAARVEAAVIEAGLGGRLDATNTIPSRVTVLTSIGLDHTEWLGETELEIAAEKLAVLRDAHDPGPRPGQPEVDGAGRAHRGRARRAADPRAGGPRRRSAAARAPGAFQRRNFALACAAAEAFLGRARPRLGAPGRGRR